MPEYQCEINGWDGAINKTQKVSKSKAKLMDGYVSATGITYSCGEIKK